ncbi:MAG: T9SS type A sorting domain-containing protein [Bacteroidia bacterium]
MMKNYALIAFAFISSALFAQQQKVSSLLPSNKRFSHNSTVNSTTHKPAYQVDYGWSIGPNVGWVAPGDTSYFTYTPTCKVKTKIENPNGSYIQKDSFAYNGADLLSEQFLFLEDTDTIVTVYYESYTYNNVGLPTQSFQMSDDNGIFDTTKTETYTYDNQNKQLSHTYFYFSNSTIVSGVTNTNSYDINGNLTTKTKQVFNTGSLTWKNNKKNDYFYDNNNVPSKTVNYNWNDNNNSWEKTDSTVNMVFDYWNGSFEDARYTTVTNIDTTGFTQIDSFYYDSQNNMIQRFNYNGFSGVFSPGYSEIYTYSYDSTNNLLEYTYLHYYGAVDSTPDTGLKQTFHDYAACATPAGISDFDKNETPVLYPNPSNGILSISNHTSISQIEVYSIYGKKVYATEAVSQTIDLTNLSKGVYIVKLQDGAQVATQKVIIQ